MFNIYWCIVYLIFVRYHRKNCCIYHALNEVLVREYDLWNYSEFLEENIQINGQQVNWDFKTEFTSKSFWSYERYLLIRQRALSLRAASLHRDLIWASNIKSLSRINPNKLLLLLLSFPFKLMQSIWVWPAKSIKWHLPGLRFTWFS